jgi:pyridoxine 5'-phosphate synthase PdxJ
MQLEFTLQRAMEQSRSAGLNSNVSRPVTVGLETAVKEMLRLMENYRG